MSQDSRLQLENSKKAIDVLVKNFLDDKLFPESFTPSIIKYISSVPLDKSIKREMVEKCDRYISGDGGVSSMFMIQRAINIKQILISNKHHNNSKLSNLLISEIDVTNAVLTPGSRKGNTLQVEYDPLSNLIIEEVDVSDYIII